MSRKTAEIKDYQLVKQYKMKGGLTPEKAEEYANKWSAAGYAVDISQEDKKGDESLAVDLTYLVEATRTVVVVDETAIAEAMAGIQEEKTIARARTRKKNKNAD